MFYDGLFLNYPMPNIPLCPQHGLEKKNLSKLFLSNVSTCPHSFPMLGGLISAYSKATASGIKYLVVPPHLQEDFGMLENPGTKLLHLFSSLSAIVSPRDSPNLTSINITYILMTWNIMSPTQTLF